MLWEAREALLALLQGLKKRYVAGYAVCLADRTRSPSRLPLRSSCGTPRCCP